jgi:hypothetical protein
VDTGDGTAYVGRPNETYIATERLQQLFSGVPGVFIVDNEYDCLRGEDIRDLLVSCGASRYLAPEATPSSLSREEKLQIRRESGLERASWDNQPEDYTLRGLNELLEILATLQPAEAATKAKWLWEALSDLEARGAANFQGSYSWSYHRESRIARFDAYFVRTLNEAAWVPNSNGELVPPRLVVFDTLGWKPNSFLQTKIAFKPPIIEQLARETGIDPAILDLLRRDPAIVAELTERLSSNSTPEEQPDEMIEAESDKASYGSVYDNANDLYGDDMPDIPSGTLDPDGGDADHPPASIGRGHTGPGAPHGSQGRGGNLSESGTQTPQREKEGGHNPRPPGHTGGRPFISYVGTHPDDNGTDPDDLDQVERMQIEKCAIDLIVSLEPTLRRTPEGNPGFDLVEVDATGKESRWVEVKSMTGTLEDRSVGLSHTQFHFAREKGDAYWLYVVEHATDPAQASVLRIQNPAGLARTFTFDHGWRRIAATEPPQ